MDITPKPLKIPLPTVVINYDSKKNPGEIYQNVLKSLVEIVYAIEGKELIEASLKELDEAKAVLSSKLFALSHPIAAARIFVKYDEPTAYRIQSTICTCTDTKTCEPCAEDYKKDLERRKQEGQ